MAGASNKPVVESKASNNEKDKTMSDMASVIEFDEDVADAEAPEPLPQGQYSATIRKAEILTSQSGNRYCAVTFFVDPNDYPVDYVDGNPDGTILIYRRVPAEPGKMNAFRMRKFCEAIGADMGSTIRPDTWIGLTGTINVAHEEYEGEIRANIKNVVSA